MSLIPAIQAPDNESAITLGSLAGSRTNFTLRLSAVNANASPTASGGTAVVIDWGDNTTTTSSATANVAQGAIGTVSAQHTYAVSGAYNVTITTRTNDAHNTYGTVNATVNTTG